MLFYLPQEQRQFCKTPDNWIRKAGNYLLMPIFQTEKSGSLKYYGKDLGTSQSPEHTGYQQVTHLPNHN